MASGANAFTSRAGFNQSGGAHFMTLTGLDGALGATGSYINTLVTAGSNSGGAFTSPTLALVAMSTILSSATPANASTIVGGNKVLKDMGRTVVSAGRTFRKFAPVVSGLGVSSFGTVGAPASGANAGYGSFYLEVGREGFAGAAGAGAPAPIVRYF